MAKRALKPMGSPGEFFKEHSSGDTLLGRKNELSLTETSDDNQCIFAECCPEDLKRRKIDLRHRTPASAANTQENNAADSYLQLQYKQRDKRIQFHLLPDFP